MVKVRQDAWSHEDDLLLAETVLRHIREGSTQLNAFEEVGDKLNRTSAACGFRWNAEVRMKYDNAIDLAKRQRKEKKRAMVSNIPRVRKPVITLPENYEGDTAGNVEFGEITPPASKEPSINMGMVIQYLKEVKKDYYASNQSKVSLEQTKKENLGLKEQINALEKQLAQTESQLSTIQEDYQTFIQIMDRARKMTVLDDQGSNTTPAFRMDKNGNLQQMAQGSNERAL
ncbi:prespore-specific regulator [Virgibacillus natechei]|uniref:Prespore-specific regulator n=1 Tax=Virgibacillus natechei TaxID=1216297 RepID=A0ABS4ICU7_9BACI|nr:RsfA family transcriptional regulator [Virgibacillus natechei]MBP1968763.1 prespore-specific regulator [Virgibacillus natechei]UZD11563.1 RsfA family transcriptional regulator [Virgibacillus natechei]